MGSPWFFYTACAILASFIYRISHVYYLLYVFCMPYCAGMCACFIYNFGVISSLVFLICLHYDDLKWPLVISFPIFFLLKFVNTFGFILFFSCSLRWYSNMALLLVPPVLMGLVFRVGLGRTLPH